ncbi:unnamed protein product [Tilletia controversa]|nr:unnamed protein product [Tilletia controversa]
MPHAEGKAVFRHYNLRSQIIGLANDVEVVDLLIIVIVPLVTAGSLHDALFLVFLMHKASNDAKKDVVVFSWLVHFQGVLPSGGAQHVVPKLGSANISGLDPVVVNLRRVVAKLLHASAPLDDGIAGDGLAMGEGRRLAAQEKQLIDAVCGRFVENEVADMPAANLERCTAQPRNLPGIDLDEHPPICISAKTGLGVDQVLHAIVTRPKPISWLHSPHQTAINSGSHLCYLRAQAPTHDSRQRAKSGLDLLAQIGGVGRHQPPMGAFKQQMSASAHKTAAAAAVDNVLAVNGGSGAGGGGKDRDGGLASGRSCPGGTDLSAIVLGGSTHPRPVVDCAPAVS